MAKFKIESVRTITRYTYNGENINVAGEATKSETTGLIESINGRTLTADNTREVGSFAGYQRDGHLRYSFTDCDKSFLADIMDAITDIEAAINDQESEGGDE